MGEFVVHMLDGRSWRPMEYAFGKIDEAGVIGEIVGFATPTGLAILREIASRHDNFRAIAKILLFTGTNKAEPGVVYLDGVAWIEEREHYRNAENNKQMTALAMGEVIAGLKQENILFQI